VFADYMRPPIRLATLSWMRVCFVFTHDSVGVGEDGPTHQPIEQLATLRAIPGLHVIRPADANETAHAWRDVVEHDGPSALVLSRQNIEVVTDGSAVASGAGVVRDADPADVIIVGTGSEVAVCVHAAERLADEGIRARVVSMPSWDRFEQQPEAARRAVFTPGVPVLSVEAGVTLGWDRYADDMVGIERFGVSAPGSEVLDKLGINVNHVAERAKVLLDRGEE
jgi:transketolase